MAMGIGTLVAVCCNPHRREIKRHNPLHINQRLGKRNAAGFPRPLLHATCLLRLHQLAVALLELLAAATRAWVVTAHVH